MKAAPLKSLPSAAITIDFCIAATSGVNASLVHKEALGVFGAFLFFSLSYFGTVPRGFTKEKILTTASTRGELGGELVLFVL